VFGEHSRSHWLGSIRRNGIGRIVIDQEGGDLAIYDIIVGIGAISVSSSSSNLSPWWNAKQGALVLGFNDKTLNPAALPPAFDVSAAAGDRRRPVHPS
jgi:hypothetical protein